MRRFINGYGCQRSFHSWLPAPICTAEPTPVDLDKEYFDILYDAVSEHLPVLANKLDVSESRHAVVRELLKPKSIETQHSKNVRFNATKQVWAVDSNYSILLRRIYATKIDPEKVLRALQQLPESENSRQASYIQANHLETLILRSMMHPELFFAVVKMLKSCSLPLTPREQAQYILNLRLSGSTRWREALAAEWPSLLKAQDTGAFNILLKLGYIAPCSDTQLLMRHHLHTPDRFTYQVRLRYDKDTPAREIVREFSEREFVTDIVVLTSYLRSLLSSRFYRDRKAAEDAFTALVKRSKGLKPVVTNPHKLSSTLQALDCVQQIVRSEINLTLGCQVPLVADETLFQKMYLHYFANGKHYEALDILEQMCEQGHPLPRHLVRRHISHPTLLASEGGLLERLFYLCCDANYAHPGFISDSLADLWARVISERTGTGAEESVALVNTNRHKM